MRRTTRTRVLSLSAAGLCACAALLPGCFQRSTYPAIPTARGFSENPNTPAGEQAVVAAVQYVASRWTPGNREFDVAQTPRGLPMVTYPMVVNLPDGTRKLFYERIPGRIGPQVLPATPESVTSGLPVFHVTRVWLRFGRGTVDVLRPALELGPGPDGQPIYQKITVRLEGGTAPWTVQHARAWNPGDDAAPAFNFVPAFDDPNEWVLAQQRAANQGQATLVTDDQASTDERNSLMPQQPAQPALASPRATPAPKREEGFVGPGTEQDGSAARPPE